MEFEEWYVVTRQHVYKTLPLTVSGLEKMRKSLRQLRPAVSPVPDRTQFPYRSQSVIRV